MLQSIISFIVGLAITLSIFFAGYLVAIYQVWVFEKNQEQQKQEIAKQAKQKRNVKKNEKAKSKI